MSNLRFILATVAATVFALVWTPLTAEGGPAVTESAVEAHFPERLVFRASAQSDSVIEKVRLRYKILPDGTAATGEGEFEPGMSVRATFALQAPDKPTFYLPPGTTIEYHWEVTDALGRTARTEPATFFYNDQRFSWTSLQGNGITIYYYSGSEANARGMLEVAGETIARMSQLLGAKIDFPVKVWIYDSVEDMRPALRRRSETFDEAVITAGVLEGSDTVLVLGSASFDTLRHELTHVVTRAAGESALGTVPDWLDEGTAVYAQQEAGGFADAVRRALERGNVLSVRSITSRPGDPDKTGLFYGQSWSLVSYLIDTYGPEKFAQLFAEIKRGKRIDAALEAVYGFDQDGLEDEWRASLGLPPRKTPEPPPEQPQGTQPVAARRPSEEDEGDGTSPGVIIGLAIGLLALAGAIAFAGWTLARRMR